MENQVFRVGEWRADARANALERDGNGVSVPPRLMDLLRFLAVHAGEVVTRQELVENCWDRSCVTDQAVTQSVFELRKILRDGRPSKGVPVYIQTVPKRGYRLIAEVEFENAADASVFPSRRETTPAVEPSDEAQPAPASFSESPKQEVQERKGETEEEKPEDRKSIFSRISEVLWLDTSGLGFKKGVY